MLFFLNFVTGILFVFFWYCSRFYGKCKLFYWPFILLIVAFLSVNRVQNSGSTGGAHYYFIVAFIISVILASKTYQYVILFPLFVGVTGVLFWIEYTHLEWIRQYASMTERYTDVSLNFVFVQIFSGILVLVLSKSLNQERKKSDRLLLNILPAAVAEELKRKDYATPRHYESATVLFTDFVGFTKFAEKMTPEELIQELDESFRVFDRIVRKNGLEKIKTIGDSYMAVGGIPESNSTHALDCVLAGQEIQQFMDDLKEDKKLKNLLYFECRLGIHTGPLVAGVVGGHKFAYDVWGDTVNTASRMESSGEAGRVNMSGTTYELIKHHCECESRGKIQAKNKGEIEMYFLSRAQDSASAQP